MCVCIILNPWSFFSHVKLVYAQIEVLHRSIEPQHLRLLPSASLSSILPSASSSFIPYFFHFGFPSVLRCFLPSIFPPIFPSSLSFFLILPTSLTVPVVQSTPCPFLGLLSWKLVCEGFRQTDVRPSVWVIGKRRRNLNDEIRSRN